MYDEWLAEQADMDRYEREEAMAVAKAEALDIEELIEKAIVENHTAGFDVELASEKIGTGWTSEQRSVIIEVLASRPYDDNTFEFEKAIVVASRY